MSSNEGPMFSFSDDLKHKQVNGSIIRHVRKQILNLVSSKIQSIQSRCALTQWGKQQNRSRKQSTKPLCLNTVRQTKQTKHKTSRCVLIQWGETKTTKQTKDQKEPLCLNTVRRKKIKQVKSNNSQSRCALTQWGKRSCSSQDTAPKHPANNKTSAKTKSRSWTHPTVANSPYLLRYQNHKSDKDKRVKEDQIVTPVTIMTRYQWVWAETALSQRLRIAVSFLILRFVNFEHFSCLIHPLPVLWLKELGQESLDSIRRAPTWSTCKLSVN